MAQTVITSDPKIMMGKPTLAGTRITVELILDKLASRWDDLETARAECARSGT